MKEEEKYDSVSGCATWFGLVGICFIIAFLAVIYLYLSYLT